MPAKASLAINDSGETPESPGTPAVAARTFVPGDVENGNVHTFYDTTTGTTAATRSKLSIQLTAPNGNSNVARLKLSLALPKAQTIDGVVQQAHVTRAFAEFIYPVDGSRDDRRDAKALLLNCLNHADVHKIVSDLEGFW